MGETAADPCPCCSSGGEEEAQAAAAVSTNSQDQRTRCLQVLEAQVFLTGSFSIFVKVSY